ncbi:hypothetical protein M896_042130 [Ordospora colligata OC4]|uniref:Uncharacterized protein n=1 Tax=Ordospora colligata OC4 TaxID=1354746 RepID=A0A0B2UKW8_9MICR|nr:uncharacterized protein M896_042130 [Ordospora colligata OC4]KHN70013.1 hypothetical protein M896_042130 [Ordospora colligata OC4]TBU16183.1 hypothetical protein CWI41_042120 [Ordospora colligata]TBU16396.1 hypothetical protein CWI40_042120 [Ordospora colligata]
MTCAEQEDIAILAQKIVSDHMLFVCAQNAYDLWNSKTGVSNSHLFQAQKHALEIRKKVLLMVENKKTIDALDFCGSILSFDGSDDKQSSIKQSLSSLVFLDLLQSGKYTEAVKFAKLSNCINRKLLTLIGYKNTDDPIFREIAVSINRGDIVREINKHLFKKETGRESSLLSLAINHYNSIVSYQNNKNAFELYYSIKLTKY